MAKYAFTKEMKNPDMRILYVLVRTDMASMTSGRSAAQVGHATTQFEYDLETNVFEYSKEQLLRFFGSKNAWKMETKGGFGTQIVLACPTGFEMEKRVAKAKVLGLHAGIVNDPEYIVQDGRAFHVISVDTCAYIFGTKAECYAVVGDMDLLRDEDFLNR